MPVDHTIHCFLPCTLIGLPSNRALLTRSHVGSQKDQRNDKNTMVGTNGAQVTGKKSLTRAELHTLGMSTHETIIRQGNCVPDTGKSTESMVVMIHNKPRSRHTKT